MPAASIDRPILARLRGEVASLRLHLALRRCWLALKYSPDQPRVPAGNPDGGQWTDGVRVGVYAGGDSAHLFRITDGDDAAPIQPYKLSGDPRIDATTANLLSTLELITARLPPGSGPTYGTMVHTGFAAAVRAENLPGIGTEGVEQSFGRDGNTTGYGEGGSIRTDVVLRDTSDPENPVLAVWDVKTGSAVLTNARVAEFRSRLSLSSDVPIYEIRVGGRVRTKAIGLRGEGAVLMAVRTRCESSRQPASSP